MVQKKVVDGRIYGPPGNTAGPFFKIKSIAWQMWKWLDIGAAHQIRIIFIVERADNSAFKSNLTTTASIRIEIRSQEIFFNNIGPSTI